MCQPTFPALLHYSANDLDQNWCRRDKRFTPGGITPGNGCSDISVGTARWFDPHFAFRGLIQGCQLRCIKSYCTSCFQTQHSTDHAAIGPCASWWWLSGCQVLPHRSSYFRCMNDHGYVGLLTGIVTILETRMRHGCE